MKINHLIATIVLGGVCVASAFNVYHQSQKEQMSDVALANIEALAGDGPGGGEISFGSICEVLIYSPMACVYPPTENSPVFITRGRLVSNEGDGAYEIWVGYPGNPNSK